MQAAFFNCRVTRRACTYIAEELQAAFDTNDNMYWLALYVARQYIRRLSDYQITRIMHYLYEGVQITNEEAQEIRRILRI